MDYYDNPNDKPQSHYEVVKDIDRIEGTIKVKKVAFQAMDQLEGWCSKFKAGVLIDLVLMLKPDTVVEIGVFGGKSLVPMAIACKANQKGSVIGVDPWSTDCSIEGMDGVNYDWWGTIDHQAILQGLRDKIIQFGLAGQIALVQSSSESAPSFGTIDILHIDGNHSEQAAVFDVAKWVPFVRTGGVVIMDDINWGGPKIAIELLEESCVKLATFEDSGSSWGLWIKK